MGVASPYQSSRPVEYWLDGLLTKELVQLWEFLSRNLDEDPSFSRARTCSVKCAGSSGDMLCPHGDLPTSVEVRKHLYSESMPFYFYACKDRGDPPRILPPPTGE